MKRHIYHLPSKDLYAVSLGFLATLPKGPVWSSSALVIRTGTSSGERSTSNFGENAMVCLDFFGFFQGYTINGFALIGVPHL